MKNKSAFTLIELSIVLVIIGLLAGGVLVGRDLIEAAKVRNQASQIEKISTAVYTFRLKYNAIPGDIPNAQQLGLGDANYHNGNGDKQIDTDCIAYTHHVDRNYSKESNNFFMHLARAGLWEGTFEGYQNENGALMTTENVQQRYAPSVFSGNYLFITRLQESCMNGSVSRTQLRNAGNSIGIGGYADIFTEAFSASLLRQLDQKFDDGDPKSGNVSFVYHYAATASVWNSVGPGATDPCLSNYATCASDKLVRPVFLDRF